MLQARKFSELPVVDADGRPVGMLDITDLIGLDPARRGRGIPPAAPPRRPQERVGVRDRTRRTDARADLPHRAAESNSCCSTWTACSPTAASCTPTTGPS